MQNYKCTRYATPSGNVWHAQNQADVGFGDTKQSAIENCCTDLENNRIIANVVSKYQSHAKQPMLVVGTSVFTRDQMPYFVLQQFEIHILFYPNASNLWVVGAVAMSKVDHARAPLFSFGADRNVQNALKSTLHNLIPQAGELKPVEIHPKQNVWLTHWLYRCPKFSMREVLNLETYAHDSKSEYEIDESASMPVNLNPIRKVQGGLK